MKRLLMLGAALFAFAGAAFGQSYSGVTLTTPVTARTYSASITGLAPAASATDFLSISGVNGHIVRVLRAECNGSATATSTALIQGIVRSTNDTGGTASTLTAVSADATDAAAQAVVKAYTANPATLGTAVGQIRSSIGVLSAASSSVGELPVAWDFGQPAQRRLGIVLRDASHQFSLNGNGASFPAGTSLNCQIDWIEQ